MSSDSENDQVKWEKIKWEKIDENKISQTLDELKKVITQGECGESCKSHFIFADKGLDFVKAAMIKKTGKARRGRKIWT